jgi:DNA-binding transcriptional LysR family regulator
MPYTLRQLEYFIAVGETGSIAQAVNRISISQASISAAVIQLERELNAQLFIRQHAKGLALTSAGRVLLREAKAIVEKAGGLYVLASETLEQVRGTLSLGCMTTLAPMLTPVVSDAFMQTHPGVRIHHSQGDPAQLFGRLERAEIDVALTYDLDPPPGVAFAPLASLPPYVILGEDHPLASASVLSLDALADEPLILLDLPHSRDYFLQLFAQNGLRPTIGAASASADVVRSLVASGHGYALFNARPHASAALNGRSIVTRPLSGDHRPMWIGTATWAGVQKSALVSAFERHCRAFMSSDRIPGMDAPVTAPRHPTAHERGEAMHAHR